MNLPPLPLPPLPALAPLPPVDMKFTFSPWYPMNRDPWEAGFYEVKDADGITWAERFYWDAGGGWSTATPNGLIAWRGLAGPAL